MNEPLSGKRILVCGKGGYGKSSIISMMAHILQDEAYPVIELDGDASNPGGVSTADFWFVRRRRLNYDTDQLRYTR